MVDYRRDDAEPGGEGWPRADDEQFGLHAKDGPWELHFIEDYVDDVSMWAATAEPVNDIVVALAADGEDDRGIAALTYMDAEAARALAAQLLTALDAVEGGERFDPVHNTSDEAYLEGVADV